MKNKFLLFIVGVLAAASMFGVTYSAWTFENTINVNNNINVEIPTWTFGDIGFAKIENVSGLSYLTASKEETITQGSPEAISFTTTGGKNSRDHVFYIDLNQDYNLYDLATCKI